MNNLLNYQLPVANWVENITEQLKQIHEYIRGIKKC